MNDAQCIAFLQSMLPRLGMRWAGFRRVRGQVCKRIRRRYVALGLPDIAAYHDRLAADSAEWRVLDSLCRISISRFYRDCSVFDSLGDRVLPGLARRAADRADATVRCWSAGCASGEEPYTLALLWRFRIAPAHPDVGLHIIATDADPNLLLRARQACYPPRCLRELPADWVAAAFHHRAEEFWLRPEYRGGIEFQQQDLRTEMPDGPFDLVLCRNLAFTYFDDAVQRDILRRIARCSAEDGYLVIGGHETLPAGAEEFDADDLPRAVFHRRSLAHATQRYMADVHAAQ